MTESNLVGMRSLMPLAGSDATVPVPVDRSYANFECDECSHSDDRGNIREEVASHPVRMDRNASSTVVCPAVWTDHGRGGAVRLKPRVCYFDVCDS